MDDVETENLIRAVLHQVVPDADLGALDRDEHLRESLGLGRRGFLRFVEAVGARSGVRIAEEDYPKLSTMDSSVRWLAGMSTVEPVAGPTARAAGRPGR